MGRKIYAFCVGFFNGFLLLQHLTRKWQGGVTVEWLMKIMVSPPSPLPFHIGTHLETRILTGEEETNVENRSRRIQKDIQLRIGHGEQKQG